MNEIAYRCPECDFEWEGDEHHIKCPQCGAEGELIRDRSETFKEKIESIDETTAESDDGANGSTVSVTSDKQGIADRRTVIRPPDLRDEIEKLYSSGDKKTRKFIEDYLSDLQLEGENEEKISFKMTDDGKVEILKGARERSIPWHRLTYEEQKEIWEEFTCLIDEVEKLHKMK